MPDEKKKDMICRRVVESPEIRSIDVDNRTVEFVASDNSVDSYKTVLPVDKWDLRRYQKNGAVGYMHDVYGDSWTVKADPDDIIGKGVAWVEDGRLLTRITFEPAELNEKADKIFRKIQFGSLNAVSVGFMPTTKGHRGDKERGEDEAVYYYDGQELLEVSVVNIPANANAIKRSIEAEMKMIAEAEDDANPNPVSEEGQEQPEVDRSAEIKARAVLAMAKY